MSHENETEMTRKRTNSNVAPDPAELARLVAGVHHDPHSILGAHEYGKQTVIRTLRPHASEVVALVGGQRYPMGAGPFDLLEIAEMLRAGLGARAGRLPEAVLWSMDAGAGVPEAGIGALLDRGMPFSAWREEGLGDQASALAGLEDEAERSAQWQALARAAVAAGACMPLLQGVQTVVRAKALSHRPSGTGWVLPHTMAWL